MAESTACNFHARIITAADANGCCSARQRTICYINSCRVGNSHRGAAFDSAAADIYPALLSCLNGIACASVCRNAAACYVEDDSALTALSGNGSSGL